MHLTVLTVPPESCRCSLADPAGYHAPEGLVAGPTPSEPPGTDTPPAGKTSKGKGKAPTSVVSTTTTVTTPIISDSAKKSSENSLLLNLLPGGSGTKDAAGIYVGEGLLPVPAKLAEKIVRWEFVEMAELLPEFWTPVAGKDSGVSHTSLEAHSY